MFERKRIREKAAPRYVRALERMRVSQEAVSAVCLEHGVKSMSLFGPITSAASSDRADVGVLVQFKEQPVQAARMVALRDVLVQLFDRRPVELVTPSVFSSSWRKRAIELQEQKVFAESADGSLRDRWKPKSRRREASKDTATAASRRS